MAAGLHLARAGYKAVLAERGRLGGQARGLGRIENYPGFPSGIDGDRLMAFWVKQARHWRLRFVRAEVRQVRRAGEQFLLRHDRARVLRARSVVFCPGADFNDLGVPGEKRFWGHGVSHAALDCAPRWRGQTVVVVGGGETAAHQALALARYARRVHLICRGDGIRAHRLLLRRLGQTARIIMVLGATVTRLYGRRRLEGVELRGQSGRMRLPVDALFVLVGKRPARLPFAAGRLPPGFFVAGDAEGGVFRQVAIAAGSGMKAAMQCIQFLENRG